MTEWHGIRARWATLSDRVYRDPEISGLMGTAVGRYLDGHPVLALSVMVFCVLAALPVGLFVAFSLITGVVAGVGCAVFEVFLLSVGGLVLISVLFGLALLSFAVSSVVSACSAASSIACQVLCSTKHNG